MMSAIKIHNALTAEENMLLAVKTATDLILKMKYYLPR